MGPYVSMDVTESALTAYRLQMDVVASNLANLNSTVSAGGAPYQEKGTVLEPGPSFGAALAGAVGPVQGVEVAAVIPEPTPPGATTNGVDVVQQMSDLIGASQAYDANVSAFSVEKSVEQKALTLGQNI